MFLLEKKKTDKNYMKNFDRRISLREGNLFTKIIKEARS